MSGPIGLESLNQYNAPNVVELLEKLVDLDPQQLVQATVIVPADSQVVRKTNETAELIIGTGATGAGAGATSVLTGGTLLALGKMGIITLSGGAILGPIGLIVIGVGLGGAGAGWMGWGMYCYWTKRSPQSQRQKDQAILGNQMKGVVQENQKVMQKAIDLRKNFREVLKLAIETMKREQAQAQEIKENFQSAQNELQLKLIVAQEANTELEKKLENFKQTTEEIPKLREDLNKLTESLEQLNGIEALALLEELKLQNVGELVELYKRYVEVTKVAEETLSKLRNENKSLKKQVQNSSSSLSSRKISGATNQAHKLVDVVGKKADKVFGKKIKKAKAKRN